jgi:dihydrolipoamide dehydrogenase
MATVGKQIKVEIEFDGKKVEELYDRVLVSVGSRGQQRRPRPGKHQGQLDEKGFIKVNSQLQTSDPHIYAIGDIAGGIMLAHKAHKEARIAVETIAGRSPRRKTW